MKDGQMAYFPRYLAPVCHGCGSISVTWDNDLFTPICESCGTTGKIGYKNESQAVEAWNRLVMKTNYGDVKGVFKEDNSPMNHRWDVEITYRTDEGNLKVQYEIMEIDELDEIVEAGPNWDTIVSINIVKAKNVRSDLVLEMNENLKLTRG